MKIIWSPIAQGRMEEISDYIAEDSAQAANNWIDRIFDEVDLLRSNPELGRVVPELQIPYIRELISGNYRVIYRIDGKTIKVMTVRNFKQILPTEDVD